MARVLAGAERRTRWSTERISRERSRARDPAASAGGLLDAVYNGAMHPRYSDTNWLNARSA
jgi:hypothetical protein